MVAFLDVIACGFGAVVLLVLILPVGDFTNDLDSDGLNQYARAQSDLANQVDINNDARVEIAGLKVMLQASLDQADLKQTPRFLARKLRVFSAELTS